MSSAKRFGRVVIGIYAWLAIVWRFVGGLTIVIVGSQQGAPPWPLLLAMAACVPVIPLIMFRGFDVLGLPLADWGLAPKLPAKSAALFAIPVALLIMAGLCFFARTVREEGLVRARVKEFVRSLSDEAHVLVDGEYFLGPRKPALLEPLAGMEAIVSPAHKSSANAGSWVVKLIDGERWMELELRRDSKRRREYWVYLLNAGSHRDLNEIGRIETRVLDDVAPVRAPDWNTKRYRMTIPGR
jgi:hypothetical protein